MKNLQKKCRTTGEKSLAYRGKSGQNTGNDFLALGLGVVLYLPKCFVAEDGPFGAPFWTPQNPPKFMWVPFLRPFPGSEAHKLLSEDAGVHRSLNGPFFRGSQKRLTMPKNHTNSTKEVSEQFEGVTGHYPVKQGFRGKSHQTIHPNVRLNLCHTVSLCYLFCPQSFSTMAGCPKTVH